MTLKTERQSTLAKSTAWLVGRQCQSSPTNGPTMSHDNIGGQNNAQMTTDIVGGRWRAVLRVCST